MKSKLSALLLFVTATHPNAGTFDDCVLAGMKGVSSDAAARLVSQACQRKDNEVRQQKQARFGVPMNDSEYELSESVALHENGYFSQVFTNKSSVKTVTYVALEIRDADYYQKQKNSGTSYFDLLSELGSDPAVRDRVRSKTYHYKLTLKPNSTVRLLYTPPRTEKFLSKVDTVLGRESRWSDSISASLGSDLVKPEPMDPLK